MLSNEPPMSFADLRPDAFPFLIQYYRMDTDELLGWNTVTGPGVMAVPGWGGKGFMVEVYVYYPNRKMVTRTSPRDQDPADTEVTSHDLDDAACEKILGLIKLVEDGAIEDGQMP